MCSSLRCFFSPWIPKVFHQGLTYISSLKHVKGLGTHIQFLKPLSDIYNPQYKDKDNVNRYSMVIDVYRLILYPQKFPVVCKAQVLNLNHVYSPQTYTQLYFLQFTLLSLLKGHGSSQKVIFVISTHNYYPYIPRGFSQPKAYVCLVHLSLVIKTL